MEEVEWKLDEVEKVRGDMNVVMDEEKGEEEKVVGEIGVLEGEVDGMGKEGEEMVEKMKEVGGDIEGFDDVGRIECNWVKGEWEEKMVEMGKGVKVGFEEMSG